MPTLNKTYDFSSDTWTKVSGGNLTPVHSASGGNTGGCYSFAVSGRRAVGTGYIELTTTWEALGVPSGSVINDVTGEFDWRCDQWSADSVNYTVGSFWIQDTGDSNQAVLIAGQTLTGSTSYATKTGSAVSIPVAIQDSNDTIKIRFYARCENGNAKTVTTGIKLDNLDLSIDYSEGATQISGDNTNQGQSIKTGDITQTHGITANGLNNSQSLQSGEFSQTHKITGTNLTHSKSLVAGEIEVTVEISIVGEDLSHSQNISSGQLTQSHQITADSLNQSKSITDGQISQIHLIHGDNLNHTHELIAGEISQQHDIVGQNLTQNQNTSSGNLYAEITISGNSLIQSQTIGVGQASVEYEIFGNNISHGHKIEYGIFAHIHNICALNINQSHIVASSNISQTQSIDGNNLSQSHYLSLGALVIKEAEPTRITGVSFSGPIRRSILR